MYDMEFGVVKRTFNQMLGWMMKMELPKYEPLAFSSRYLLGVGGMITSTRGHRGARIRRSPLPRRGGEVAGGCLVREARPQIDR